MYLIIAEKRSAAEKVGSCIKGESFKKGDGFIQSQNYYITWCAGHLYTLLDLEEYDPNYDPNEKHIFRCFWPKLNEIISWLLLQVLVLVAKEFIRSFLKTSWILAI